ncbi:Uncharacterised protein [Mycolicibacterium vanbaalenii]|uniref:Uncharacterized protein n=1 Tax=Mycolicibacterium vanbaalenii TaxID=110539 RepID=A0A5S9R9G2_MYCVN|nr:Uncharacterised protein [Mycolicibacterium vanbaalenii]
MIRRRNAAASPADNRPHTTVTSAVSSHAPMWKSRVRITSLARSTASGSNRSITASIARSNNTADNGPHVTALSANAASMTAISASSSTNWVRHVNSEITRALINPCENNAATCGNRSRNATAIRI